ncbi:MAG: LptE family protein [bacterium]
MKAFRNVLWLLLAAAAAGGCAGYTHGFRLPPGAEGVETVAIDLFKNKTLYTDLENEFALALQREIEAKTPLRVASRGSADAVMTGSIDDYDRVVLREFETDQVSRYRIVLTVSYVFERLPSGGAASRVIQSEDGLRRSAEYEVRSADTEADARAEAVRKTARKLVSHVFETW